ncbi:MAG: hypothetical protein IJR35_02655 [Synergistaceae bacterium]|nr:hypothetical protein [Synergistaceae bacterium]MBQ9594741.1 hypothetical protein [Synergistaceae bacterium]MBR0204020.1 hypothetical protein [Synergistaceae bacterium]
MLKSCKLCGRAFNSEGLNVCLTCFRRLEEVYTHAHDYLRDNTDEKFDMVQLADLIGADPRDIQELLEMGWLDRDIELYLKKNNKNNGVIHSPRQIMARKFGDELDKMKMKTKQTMYGGEIYQRKPRWR